jgi:signal transduction histidine kinase
VRRAVDNLLANALKHAARRIEVALTRRDDLLTIVVSDDGPGIPTEKHELVFEPFHRLEHGQPGAGLGLAIVREVAHAHGGRAFVRAATGGMLVLELHALEPAATHGPQRLNEARHVDDALAGD